MCPSNLRRKVHFPSPCVIPFYHASSIQAISIHRPSRGLFQTSTDPQAEFCSPLTHSSAASVTFHHVPSFGVIHRHFVHTIESRNATTSQTHSHRAPSCPQPTIFQGPHIRISTLDPLILPASHRSVRNAIKHPHNHLSDNIHPPLFINTIQTSFHLAAPFLLHPYLTLPPLPPPTPRSHISSRILTILQLTMSSCIIQLYNLQPRPTSNQHNLLPLCPRERADNCAAHCRRGL
jgi:hypothetical protein